MKRILVVDDSPVARRYHGSILKRAGFQVAEAADGLEALEMTLAGRYDLILCDINMAGMDGITFIRKFREAEPRTPIIMITTQPGDADRDRSIRSGADLFIRKPVQPEKLLLHVRMSLGEDRP